MEEEEESGLSLGEIFHIIGKRIWAVLGGSVLLALIAVLVFALAINPLKSKSSLEFRVRYPMSTSEKYPDGSPFYYNVFVATDILEDNEEYKTVDMAELLKKEKISISATTTKLSENNTDTVYKLTVKNSVVARGKAEDFMRAIIDAAANRIKENAKTVDYSINAETFEDASFKEQLELLNNQKETLVEQYNRWIKEYTAAYKVDNKTLGNYLSELKAVYGDSTSKALAKSIELYGLDGLDLNYYKGREAFMTDGKLNLDAVIADRKKVLANELVITLKTVKQLSAVAEAGGGAGSGTVIIQKEDGTTTTVSAAEPTVSQLLASYIKRAEEIKYQIGEGYVNETTYEINAGNVTPNTAHLTKESVTEINEQIAKQYEGLQASAQKLKSMTTALYESDTFIAFESEKVQSSGTTSIILVAVAVFVVAFLILCVAAYFVGRKQVQSALKPQQEATGSKEE